MEIIEFNHNSSDKEFTSPSTLVIGKFETFHKGHQELIRQAKEHAFNYNQNLIVLLYEMNSTNNLVFSNSDRIKIAKKLGIKHLIFFQGNQADYNLTLEQFAKILKEKFTEIIDTYNDIFDKY